MIRRRQNGDMSQLGRQDGDPLLVDLSDRTIESWSAMWDSLITSCGLPEWFGRNLNAWWDTIDTGAISSVIDEHPSLVVRVAPTNVCSRQPRRRRLRRGYEPECIRRS